MLAEGKSEKYASFFENAPLSAIVFVYHVGEFLTVNVFSGSKNKIYLSSFLNNRQELPLMIVVPTQPAT